MDDGLPCRRVHRALQPAGEGLPGDARRAEPFRAVAGEQDRAALGGGRRHESLAGEQRRQRGFAAAAVAPVEGMAEQLALPRLVRRRARVDEVDHVAEAEAPGRGVVLQQGPLGVEPPDGVRDAALDRLGQRAAVDGRPVGEGLARLVGTLQDARDELPVAAVEAGVEPCPHGLQGGDDRGGAHAGRLAEPRQEPGRPLDVVDGDPADEVAEACVAVARVLVEGVLADHVRDGEQEQLALGVAGVAGRALVGAARRRRFAADRAGHGPADGAAIELRHGRGSLPRNGGSCSNPGPRINEKSSAGRAPAPAKYVLPPEIESVYGGAPDMGVASGAGGPCEGNRTRKYPFTRAPGGAYPVVEPFRDRRRPQDRFL
jgi:hypothetical protein